jgi:hypothetical protein
MDRAYWTILMSFNSPLPSRKLATNFADWPLVSNVRTTAFAGS